MPSLHLFQFFQCQRKGFFNEDMLACVQGFGCESRMVVVTGHDDHGVDLVRRQESISVRGRVGEARSPTMDYSIRPSRRGDGE